MRAALLLLIGLPLLLLPVVRGQHRLSGSDVERALRAQMNGSPAGAVTRRVDCTALGRSRYSCVLTGSRGSHTRAVVAVSGSSWRADWAPLQG